MKWVLEKKQKVQRVYCIFMHSLTNSNTVILPSLVYIPVSKSFLYNIVKTTDMDNGEVKCDFNGHCSSLLNSFKKMLENRELCDVILTVGMKQFHVHKVILAASSPYFQAMFTSALQESALKEIDLKGTNAETVETLINCVYESTLTITVENATSVLALAAQWQMEKVVEVCGTFIGNHLDIENCLEMLIFADVHGCDVLKKAATDVSIVDFSGVCQTEAFVNAPMEILLEFLKFDILVVQSEEKLFEDLLKWFNHSPELRRSDILKMLDLIKFPLIPWEVIEEKLKQNRLYSEQKCKRMLTNVRNFQMHPKKGADYNMEDPVYVPRSGSKPIYVIVSNKVEQYDPTLNQWKRLTSLPTERYDFKVCTHQGLLYVIGGRDKSDHYSLNLVECYDLKSGQWSRRADMLERRSQLGVGVVDGYLYVVGGAELTSFGLNILQSVERYDPEKNQWSFVAPLKSKRCQMTIVTDKTTMYAVGGRGKKRELATCEVYNSVKNKWSIIATMNVPRCNAGACMVDRLLYVFCGNRDEDAEVFNPVTKTWKMISGMSKAQTIPNRKNLLASQGRIVVIGRSYWKHPRTVEYYNSQTMNWYILSEIKSENNFEEIQACCI